MLSLDHVSVTFNEGTANEVRALQDLSLFVEAGEFITAIGSNGAGKSTLFNVISGAVQPMPVALSWTERISTYWHEYRRSHNIGRVFQDPRLGTCPGLTIRENLSLAAIHGRQAGFRRDVKKAQDAWFFEQLEQQHLGLENRLDADVALLSGGQRQAITLIMATLTKPKLLLLDEHTAALDPNAAEQVISLTQQLAADDDKPTIALLKWGDLNTVALAEKGVLDMLQAYGYINEDERAIVNEERSLEGENINIMYGDALFDRAQANFIIEDALTWAPMSWSRLPPR